MKVELEKASINQKPILCNLMELYLYDFSEFDRADVNENGIYGDEHLNLYWIEPNRFPYIIKVDSKIAGFVLVRILSPDDGPAPVYSIAEFFVMKKYRSRGIGRTVAFKIFDMYPGEWKITGIEQNKPAQQFWKKVISEYTQGSFQEVTEEGWKGAIQKFST